MATRTILVTVAAIDPQEISRGDSGAPRVASHTQQARLYLATLTDDGGWLLETWREGEGYSAHQQMDLFLDADGLVADIARAVRDVMGVER